MFASSLHSRHALSGVLALALTACALSSERETLTNGVSELADKDGNTVIEGDILLAPGEKVGRAAAPGDKTTFGLVINDPAKLWPERVVPYAFETGFTQAAVDQIRAAMNEWATKAKFTFLERTNQAAYVVFRPNTANSCSSFVGRQGRDQAVNLPANGSTCPAHEIGHAIGLFHEQSRGDREKYITIHLENVTEGREGNFRAQLSGAEYVQPYDFGSIMHYGYNFFSKNGKPTITKIDGSIEGFGNRKALSKSDVESVDIVYTKYRPRTPTTPAPGTPPPPTANPNKQLVEKYYRDVLGRAAAASEVDFWLKQIDAGATRNTVALSFVDSTEARNGYVGGLYSRVLGRGADQGGFDAWSYALSNGMSRETMLARFAASDEAYGRAGSANRPWVTSLYKVILGRDPDTGGLDRWTAQADAGASRNTISDGFVQSDELLSKLVSSFYVTYLRRQPDSGGLATYTQAYRAGHRNEQIQAWILASEEYFQRAP